MIEKSLSYVYRPRGYADGGSVVQVTSPTNPKVQVTSPTNPVVQVTQPVSEPVPNSPGEFSSIVESIKKIIESKKAADEAALAEKTNDPQKSLADITTMAVGEEDNDPRVAAKLTTMAVGEEDGTVTPDIPESGFGPVTTAAVGEEEGTTLEKPFIIPIGPSFEVTTQAVGEEDGAVPAFIPSNFGPVAVSQPVTQAPSLFNRLGGGTSDVFNRATSLDYANPFLRKPGDPL
jgi:hypothetical protein